MSLPMLTATRHALRRAERATQDILKAAGRPTLRGSKGREWWQFGEEGILQVIAVKAARAVSGLNACVHLMHAGHSMETAVLLRTVDDFLDEIVFLLEGHNSGIPTTAQNAFVEDFFAEDILPTDDLLKDRKRPDRTKRKDIRAAQARFLSDQNPDPTRRMVMALDNGWDGYVHGGYPHSMELFNPLTMQWALEGSMQTPYLKSVQRHHACYVSRALAIFAFVLLKIGDREGFESLKAQRDEFEGSDEYPHD